MEELIKRKIAEYENVISELEKINEENKTFLENASNSKDVPLATVQERMMLAKDNLVELNFLKAHKEYIENKYLKK